MVPAGRALALISILPVVASMAAQRNRTMSEDLVVTLVSLDIVVGERTRADCRVSGDIVARVLV
jgi:hypothetical protein